MMMILWLQNLNEIAIHITFLFFLYKNVYSFIHSFKVIWEQNEDFPFFDFFFAKCMQNIKWLWWLSSSSSGDHIQCLRLAHNINVIYKRCSHKMNHEVILNESKNPMNEWMNIFIVLLWMMVMFILFCFV